jgi:hypothetical protein
MTFSITATSASPRHGHYEIDGEKYVRVSTVLGIIAKPGLEAWRQKVGAEEANRISNEAAEHGTALHKILEDIDLGFPIPEPSMDDATIEAYLMWKREHVRRVLMVEQRVHHERLRFAGTLDRLYELHDGRRLIYDVKTGRSVDGIYRLQGAAYWDALEAMGEDGIDGRGILHLPRALPGTLRAWEYDDDERDRKCWRAVLRLYRWHQRRGDEWRSTR